MQENISKWLKTKTKQVKSLVGSASCPVR